ncbi:MAG: aldo/keto reductase [Oscillospiraceae bacterium]|nr:aldo/keto reductase [Oscillospiraceae bacterium]
MRYRDYGTRSGDKISILGFGCMRLPEFERNGKWYVDQEKTTEMLLRAAELGVNYFDTGYFYCNKNSERAVGEALKPIRDKVMISTKLPMGEIRESHDYRGWLENSLRELDTDYIDYYHFWALGLQSFREEVLAPGLMNEARKAKEEGLIRNISFSFHDDPAGIREIIDRGEVFDSMLVQYNLLDRANEEMIAYAASKGLGVAAMGPVGGGRLSAPTQLHKRLTGSESAMPTYELALKYVMGNPNVSCALSGMQDMDMLLKNVAVANDPAPLTPEEWSMVNDSLEKLARFSDLYCTGCAYCQPCPAGIDIPKIFYNYTCHNVYELKDHAKKEHGKYLEKSGKTSADCTDCGFCESKCPQKLAIRKELARVERVLA